MTHRVPGCRVGAFAGRDVGVAVPFDNALKCCLKPLGGAFHRFLAAPSPRRHRLAAMGSDASGEFLQQYEAILVPRAPHCRACAPVGPRDSEVVNPIRPAPGRTEGTQRPADPSPTAM